MPSDKTTVFQLYREVSDQYGTYEVVGIFSSREKAEASERMIRARRTFIKEVPLDPTPPRVPL